MSTEVATRTDTDALLEAMVLRGDLSGLDKQQQTALMKQVCEYCGVNPLLQPFEFLTLQGKKVLYAKKSATDQIRSNKGITLSIVSSQTIDGLLTVKVKATDRNGRSDEDVGSVFVGGLKGEQLANATMKAITKAKRRTTLSIAGLGFLDESEVEDAEPEYVKQRTVGNPRVHPALTQDARERMVDAQTEDNIERVPDLGRSAAERAASAPIEISRGDDKPETWRQWWGVLMAYVRAAPDVETINEWTTANAKHLEALRAFDLGKYNELIRQIEAVIAGLNEAGT